MRRKGAPCVGLSPGFGAVVESRAVRSTGLMLGLCLLWLIAGLMSGQLVCGADYTDYNPLSDTGQTKCYDTSGHEISCTGTGQDGAYYGLPQWFRKFINYNNTGDDVTVDYNTGLMWMTGTADTNNDGQIDSNDKLNWQNAVNYCYGLTYAGYSDWRLPNVFELTTIVNYGSANPAIYTTYFSAMSLEYWSSTPRYDAPSYAWAVHFSYGGQIADFKSNNFFVRCVRS